MPDGVIAGGWPYVIAAYGVTAVVMVLYAWSLRRRGRVQRWEEEDDG